MEARGEAGKKQFLTVNLVKEFHPSFSTAGNERLLL
jgi:hypothetical protein